MYAFMLMIISNEMKSILETKMFLSYSFKIKDLGKIDTILGIKVEQNNGSFELGQSLYVDKVLDKFKNFKFK